MSKSNLCPVHRALCDERAVQVSRTYDGIYRLTNETIALAPSHNNGSVSYSLDAVDNRTSASSGIAGLSPIAGTFNADDELASETYDQNGNVTFTGGKNFTYNLQPTEPDAHYYRERNLSGRVAPVPRFWGPG